MKKGILLFISIFCLFSGSSSAQQMFQHLLGLSTYPNYTWTGTSADGKWSTALNWSGNAVPGAGDTAHFIASACGTNCNANMDMAINIGGMDIQSGYGGTITQGAGRTVTIGTAGWSQAAGTFTGSDSDITMNGNFSVSGGTFTSSTATLKTVKGITWANSAFNANNGSLLITAPWPTVQTLSFGTNTVQNLKFYAGSGFDGYDLNITGTVTVAGAFVVEDGGAIAAADILGGTFILKGDVTNSASVYKISMTGTYKIAGSTNQTITGSANGGLANLEIASTGGTVTFASASFMNVGNYKYTSGTVVMPTNFIQSAFYPTSVAFIPSTLNFTNLEIRQDCNMDGYTMTMTGTTTVNGNLSFTRPGCPSVSVLNGGQFSVKGNVSSTTEYKGTTPIKVSGSTNQTISGSGMLNHVEIVSTGGTVTISGTPTFRYDFTYTSGTVSATGSTVIFAAPWGTGPYALNPGAMAFDNVTFLTTTNNDGINFNLGGGTLNVLGNLLLSHPDGGVQASITNGTILVGKNLTSSGINSYAGNAVIQLNGASAGTINVGTALPSGDITSGKNAATATLAAAWNVGIAGQSLSVTSGVLDLAGYNLTVNNVLTVGANGKLVCNGGTVTAGTLVLNGQVFCPTTIGTTWTGLAGNNLWNDAGNWSNNTIPGATDIAIFNSSCTGANCNVTINTSISVKGVKVMAGYTGTITQGAGNTITVGTSGWSQAAGTFAASSDAITFNGASTLTAGTFTSTSGTLTIANNFTISGATFNANGGTVSISGPFGVTQAITPGTAQFNNVTLGGNETVINVTGTMNVLGALNLSDAGTIYPGYFNSGTIAAQGAVTASVGGKRGVGVVKISGTASQTVTGTSGAFFPSIEIASTGGTVNLAGDLVVWRNYTHTSGTVNAGTSTLIFKPDYNVAVSITPGTVSYNNVNFWGNSTAYNLTGTMTVAGTLTIQDDNTTVGGINGGTIEALGDVSALTNGKVGTVLLKIKGSTNQTLTGISTANWPSLEIASTGGTVTFSGTLLLPLNFTYTSGTVNAGTSTLFFKPGASGATITPGSVNYNNVTFGGSNVTNTLAGNMTVMGTLTLQDMSSSGGFINGSIIDVKGDLAAWNYGKLGTTKIRISGAADQTITGVATAPIPEVEVASTGGTVYLSGTLRARYNWTWTSGALNAGTSTIQFIGQAGGGAYTVTPGTVAYNNISFSSNSNYYTINGTMTVNGNLTLDKGTSSNRTINSGAIEVYGNVIYSGNGYQGSTTITMKGSTATTLGTSASADRTSGLFTIDKSGGAQVSLTIDNVFTEVGSSLTLLNGNLDLSGYILGVDSVLTVSAGTTLSCNGGRISYGSLVNNGTINCPGYSTYSFNWTGATGDGKWSTAGNWQGGAVPTANDYPNFDSAYCGANCNVNVDIIAVAKGVKIASGYTGTITQSAGKKITIGKRGWIQAGGTFTGAAATDMDITGAITLTGGTFTAPGGIFSLGKALPEYGSGYNSATTMTISGSATFNHGSGTLNFERGISGGGGTNVTHTIDVPANTNFYKVGVFNSIGGSSVRASFLVTNPVNVNGDFVDGNSVVGNNMVNVLGTWNIKGNLKIGASATGGDVDALVLSGTGNQTYTYEAGGIGGGLKINKASGTVTAAAGTTDLNVVTLNVNAGTFTPPTGTVTLSNSQDTSFTVLKVAAGASFTAPATMVMNLNQNNSSQPVAVASIDVPSGFVMKSLDAKLASDNTRKINFKALNPITVNGNLSIGDTPTYTSPQATLDGTWTVKGNLNIGKRSFGGTASINLSGTSAQTITQTGTSPSGAITIANPAGVALTTAAVFNSVGQTFSITSGSLNMAGFALTLKSLTLSAGTSISRNAGVLTVNGGAVGAGAYSGGTISN